MVWQGETLAQIAIRFYGTPRFEAAIIGANSLDAHGGSAIVPGQPIEIPAPGHHRVQAGDTWFTLSKAYLGDSKRADILARANRTVAWTPPVEHQEIEIPAVIAHNVGESESLTTLATRYYNADVHRAALAQPEILRGALRACTGVASASKHSSARI